MCSAVGSKHKECTVCHATIETVEIAKKAHNYVDKVVAPTEDADGYTEHKCSVCGDTYKDKYTAYGSTGLAYTVNADGETCTITGIGTCSDTKVIIPKKIDGYTVTAIGQKAFADCTGVTGIVIPSTVATIENRAFYNTGITEITIPASVSYIGTQIFYKCTALKTVNYNSNFGPNDSSKAFLNIASIETLNFGGTSVPSYILYNCSNVKNVNILVGVTYIGKCAFNGCSSLASITIPKSVTSIEAFAFYSCSSLTSITIPDSVTSIGGYAFFDCSSLASITIPDRVTSIGEYAFFDCSSLASITIPDSVTGIGECAFWSCSSLASITIPDSVTSIGEYAFLGCSSLASITISDSVTSIGRSAFSGCNSLTSITIPDSVTSIGRSTFDGCSSLTSITIPDSVTSIEDSVFQNCSSLTSITFVGTIEQWMLVSKNTNWNMYSCITTVHCSDGDITL